MSTYDAIVIGLGALGAATLDRLSRRGLRVLGLERFAPPHDRGSSYGELRITREAIGEGAQYVPLAQRSHRLWREIERESGESLFVACGLLVIGRRGGAARHHGQSDFVGNYRQVQHWLMPDEPGPFTRGRFPVFIWMYGAHEGAHLYGFPSDSADGAVKIASEQYGTPVNPDAVDRTVTAGETQAMFEQHVRGRVLGLQPRAARASVCLYTSTPDGGFVVDAHPQMPGVTIASACSGHGFKHSPAIGEAVAERIASGTSMLDIAPFALARLG